jgi:RecA/RadA recombinase
MIRGAMERSHESLERALATLQTRWGSAAVRLGNGRPTGSAAVEQGLPAVHGALALAVLPDSHPGAPQPAPAAGVISTGFPALDAILGPMGLPAEASVAVRGGPSSGKTTLALRCAAEAQASGDIVAWLDLARAFDPVEAVGRGVDLRWLLVIRPAAVPEGLSLAGSLLTGRCIGLLVVDLPARLHVHLDQQLRRLAAHARRVGARLILLEPASLAGSLGAALAGSTSLRLELERRAWLRLGRDVVGQRTAVAVAKNRYGPPGRSVDLDIHYLAEGERSLATHQLASDDAGTVPALAPPVGLAPTGELAPTGGQVPLASPGPAVLPGLPGRSSPRLVVV